MDEPTDKELFRAFVEPALYPFILQVYKGMGKGEEILKEDIRKARESYKEIVKKEKKSKPVKFSCPDCRKQTSLREGCLCSKCVKKQQREDEAHWRHVSGGRRP